MSMKTVLWLLSRTTFEGGHFESTISIIIEPHYPNGTSFWYGFPILERGFHCDTGYRQSQVGVENR